MQLPHSSIFRTLFLLAWISILVGLFFQVVGVAYSMDVRREFAKRQIIGMPPAGYTPEVGLGLTMLTPLDLASLFAPLFILCGIHGAPEITPTFSYYLIVAAKIWAVVTLIRLFFAVVWFTTSIASLDIDARPPGLMLCGVWLLLFGQVFCVWAFSILCCVHVEGCGSCEVHKAAGVCCCKKGSSCNCNKADCGVCTSKRNGVVCYKVATAVIPADHNTRVTDADDNSMMMQNMEEGKRRKKSGKKIIDKDEPSNTL